MTLDEKLAVISGILRDSAADAEDASSIRQGALFELAMIAAESYGRDDALDLARLIIPGADRESLARFCLLYCKYSESDPMPFDAPESAELPDTVIIPEIARLDETLDMMAAKGIILDRIYEDSFSACAEDVEYGHSRYVLMPLYDPAEGRLRSFDRLRDLHSLKIHAVVNVPAESGGYFSYQLCALGFPGGGGLPITRLSVSADTDSHVLGYLNGAAAVGASLISAELESGRVSRVRAVFDIAELDSYALSALIMYLNSGADLTIDGCFAEL